MPPPDSTIPSTLLPITPHLRSVIHARVHSSPSVWRSRQLRYRARHHAGLTFMLARRRERGLKPSSTADGTAVRWRGSDQHEQDNHRHLRLALCAMERRVLSEGADPGSGTCIRITPVRRHRTTRLVLFAAAARVLPALVRADATRFRLHRERDRKSAG